MTVGIAALANIGRSTAAPIIVCVADESLPYGNDFPLDTNSTKIVPLDDDGTLVLAAGSARYTTQLLAKIQTFSGYRGRPEDIASNLQNMYGRYVEEVQDAEVLARYGFTRREYLSSVNFSIDNPVLEKIDVEFDRLKAALNCELLVCGFGSGNEPYIIYIGYRSPARDCSHAGFHAIGEGSPYAIGRLLFVGGKGKHHVSHALYDCFDAKAIAEMEASVSYEWDGYFISSALALPLMPDPKRLINRVWAFRNRSPFNDKQEPHDPPHPPRDWRNRLVRMVQGPMQILAARG